MNQEIPYNKSVIGTCSVCGGPVTVHTSWFSVTPDTPRCERCGAIAAQSFGQVIPMISTPYRETFTTTGASAEELK